MVVALVVSAAARLAGNVASELLSPYVRYFFSYGEIVEEFENQLERLELKKKDAAIRQTELIQTGLQEWRKEADKELEEARELETEIDRQMCFNWCPSWGWRFCLSKKIAEKTLSINKLLERYERVSRRRAPLEGIEFFLSDDFKSSKSSNLAFDGIMRALNTNGVNMIGLYGMPGVGKTTLAKEVGRQAKEQKLFKNVLMVTMSQNPNFSYIRDRIAELLDLKFKATTEEGKAEELWRRLKGVEKILIIIDDIWNEVILRTVGIPFGQHEGCKILLTTRRQQVCVQMNCQEEFQLDILSEDEAWALFKDNAGLNDATSTLIKEAKEVASECKGLPLALATIGKALKGADLNGWKAANRRLKDSRHLDNEHVCGGLYKCLELSYDYLEADNIRSCFLLCSLFPEDFNIGIEWLIIFGSGYGLFPHVSMDVLRVEICEALKILQESGLLLKTDDEEGKNEIYVCMHDVVRDFAHWTTLREKNAFMIKEGLTEWPISESFGCCTSISFWKTDINSFPDKLEFPELKILVFEGKNLVRVPSAFVEGMKALRILYLKNVSFSLEVFKIVKNLRTLCFEDCELKNISSLKNLENLEILALLKTNIYELPEDLVELRKLKSLHFYCSASQEVNFPPNLLSRLTSLQELHVTCENNVNLSELNSLSRLTALSLTVSRSENFVFPANLQSFTIIVNEGNRQDMKWLKFRSWGINNRGYMEGLKFRSLEIYNCSSSLSAFKELFCNTEELILFNVMKHKNIVPSLDQKGLNELNILRLRRCDDMECLMDTTRENRPTPVFSNLVKLYMDEMAGLKELCGGSSRISFLQKLKHVSISSCWQLKTVFQIDGFLEKEEMVEPQVLPLSNLTYLRLQHLPKLVCIWKEPDHCFKLQSLKVAEFVGCNRLKYLFSPSLAQSLVLLQQLKIKYCNELEYIITESDSGHLHPPLFPKLTSLEIRGCERLEYVFQIPLGQGLPHLKSLEITDAPGLKHDFNVAKEKNAVDHAIALPCLQHLHLDKLINLSCFCSENYPIVSPSLERLSVSECPQLEIFNIQQEGNKEIQLKIIEMDPTARASSSQAHLQPVSFPSLFP